MNLQKLINFQIYNNNVLQPDYSDEYIFWKEQFSGCTSLASADIIFNFSNNGKSNMLSNLFAGCVKLSYIRVRDESTNSNFIASNDWLIAEDLPTAGTLILPIKYKISDVENIISGFTQNTENIVLLRDVNNNPIQFKQIVENSILPENCISSLLIKEWTIKFEE
jgi:hypothetical protein